ncbi:cytochrome c oxidase subunit II [Sphingomonas sp. ABOLD]|uniref:cytochrome-c oxidase n=1 Tax=Sphingomonas trueperi TaxID=53317 RepID=A0A7X6BER0_9SPHN|nr:MULTISPECIES: cytochrome c oxidase subunit II [Sphingomonas]NJB99933.1 cytochrome c oxidase subunit 2 [Sphingomonas trueperi]RSV35842.1 cytochrome c oxidase subunit II [Sphingomonas sp. ABOLE]RSV40371.1 cytochrome c oxidase subunit II [Sphingomonas sp. ABOLD]
MSGLQSALEPAGEQAAGIHGLFWLMMLVCGAMYLLVLGGVAWTLWRAFRRRRPASEPTIDPPDIGLNRGMLGWAGLIVVGLTVLITASFLVERNIAAARARDALEVRVTGHQWWWRIEYRDPRTGGWIETANELHLPLGRTTRVALGSADVIHSFWVPNIAQKLDVIPGRINLLDLTPTRPGWFRGQCAEFCGVQHAHMAFDVKVDAPEDFERWLAGQAKAAAIPADPVAARGQQVVTGGQCAMCHTIRGTPSTGRAGPDLTHFGSRRSVAAGTLTMSRGAVQGWIAQPQALKPGTMMPPVALSGPDADAASRYLMELQ